MPQELLIKLTLPETLNIPLRPISLTKQHIGWGFFIVNALGLGSKRKRRLKAQLKIMRTEVCGNRTQATQE